MLQKIERLLNGAVAVSRRPQFRTFVHLAGKVTQIVWNNPHVMIHMTEAGDRAWTLEAAGPDNLTRKGWSRDTLKIGDQITVQGFRAKSEPMTAAARVVELPGGNIYEMSGVSLWTISLLI
jgi:hypothetical protein